MWDWIRRWFSTRTRQASAAEQAATTAQVSTLERLVLTQQSLLEEIVRRQQATIEAQQQTIDRVVGLHYDRPMERLTPRPSDWQMPAFGMSDQADSRPSDETVDPVAQALGRINVESDAEFLGEQ
jgi:hypothetical protein